MTRVIDPFRMAERPYHQTDGQLGIAVAEVELPSRRSIGTSTNSVGASYLPAGQLATLQRCSSPDTT